ncbi:hypothetical protein JKP88DRAFT_334494 [Tribonema minus]|uniref:Uncharacterized protein n=1 Tax=Tribonema minus TaxID=303371 RepID=A0A835YTF0_9STRA|nr:hypothetical protein JKP88DRAFT_334494 [Tribonema minus]
MTDMAHPCCACGTGVRQPPVVCARDKWYTRRVVAAPARERLARQATLREEFKDSSTGGWKCPYCDELKRTSTSAITTVKEHLVYSCPTAPEVMKQAALATWRTRPRHAGDHNPVPGGVQSGGTAPVPPSAASSSMPLPYAIGTYPVPYLNTAMVGGGSLWPPMAHGQWVPLPGLYAAGGQMSAMGVNAAVAAVQTVATPQPSPAAWQTAQATPAGLVRESGEESTDRSASADSNGTASRVQAAIAAESDAPAATVADSEEEAERVRHTGGEMTSESGAAAVALGERAGAAEEQKEAECSRHTGREMAAESVAAATAERMRHSGGEMAAERAAAAAALEQRARALVAEAQQSRHATGGMEQRTLTTSDTNHFQKRQRIEV